MLGAPPLLLLGLPVPVAAALTRPRLVDHVALACSRPKVAVVVVVLIAVGSLTAPAVHAQNSSLLWRAVFDTLILLSGIVLWTPVLRWVPGTTRPSPLARTAYLIIQSIVPSFLAIVWIFARHPLYPAYDYKGHVLGLSALGEQQIAGFVAKLGTIAVLWTSRSSASHGPRARTPTPRIPSPGRTCSDTWSAPTEGARWPSRRSHPRPQTRSMSPPRRRSTATQSET